MILDSDSIPIYKSCQYGFTPLNSTDDKSDWAFEEETVTLAMTFVAQDYSKLKIEKLANI